jgi:hypothetical protein
MEIVSIQEGPSQTLGEGGTHRRFTDPTRPDHVDN